MELPDSADLFLGILSDTEKGMRLKNTSVEIPASLQSS